MQKNQKPLLDEIKITNFIEPRSVNQSIYLESMYKNTFTFGVGLAGTGKSLIGVYAAIQELLDKESKINKVVIIRPVVGNDFGENIGALPGDLGEKMLPWALSIRDNLEVFMDKESARKLIEKQYIEFIPLSLLRGRSLNNSFIIVEESQNIKKSAKGVYMIMSRLGNHSKMVFNGDLRQSDISNDDSALMHAIDILEKPKLLKGVGICRLYEREDVQRNKLLHRVMERFGEADVDPF